MKILVCDDNPSRGDAVIEHIHAAQQPTMPSLTGRHLTNALRDLFKAINTFRTPAGEAARQWDFTKFEPIKSPFDEADVLLLDNNLTLLDNDGPPLTAESIAGYVRAFTGARYIVSLNMNPDVDFDLRYLVGDFLTRADLAINAEHLENRYLWTGKPQDSTSDFCPWYWPRLGDVAEYRLRQMEFIHANFDNSVLDCLGFDEESVQMLSRHAQGALSPDATPGIYGATEGRRLLDVTFREFFLAKSRALPVQDERDGLNAAYEQNEAVQRVVARIVAADLDLWLRRDVIGPQEPLVDVPHLTGRFPFLLGDGASLIQGWNDVVTADKPPYGWDRSHWDRVNLYRFRPDIWFQKACFWWPKLRNDEYLNTLLLTSASQKWANVVFCEDVSKFVYETREGVHSAPVEFVAEFEGVWNRRYIAKRDGIQYAPLTRLAL